MVSCSGVSRYSKSSGTGRCPLRTTAISRPVMACRLCSMARVSPSVADISRKVVSGIASSGICQATPRSRSE